MWLIVYSNNYAPLTVRPIYSSSKLRTAQMMIFSLVVMIGLEKCCITSAYLQWLCHSGERVVAHGPLVSFFISNGWRFKQATHLILGILVLYYAENRIWHFVQIVSTAAIFSDTQVSNTGSSLQSCFFAPVMKQAQALSLPLSMLPIPYNHL